MSKARQLREEKDKAKENEIRIDLGILTKQRAAEKQKARKKYQEAAKKRTELTRLIEKCEGEALINLKSNEQLLAALNKIKGLHSLPGVADEELLKYNDHPLIQVLRKYRKGSKKTSTYGVEWTQRWVTKPCKEEGYRHPGDEDCTANSISLRLRLAGHLPQSLTHRFP